MGRVAARSAPPTERKRKRGRKSRGAWRPSHREKEEEGDGGGEPTTGRCYRDWLWEGGEPEVGRGDQEAVVAIVQQAVMTGVVYQLNGRHFEMLLKPYEGGGGGCIAQFGFDQ